MIITAKDKTKPVLLFLSGGPGIPEYLLVNEYPTSLAEEFIVCYLDYRGTSLSYDKKLSAVLMTTDSYLSDVFAVSEYLKERFNKDKIYLLGHSFGTYMGLLAAYKKPELYEAYFAMSQITNQKESEIIAYNYMVENYTLSGKPGMTKFEKPEKAIEILKSCIKEKTS